jgi:hypothetical protein
MAAASLDTHALVRELTTGTGKVSEATAEKLVTAMKTMQDTSRGDLATKGDIVELRGELADIRGELKALRGEMQGLFWKLAAVFIIANAVMRYLPSGHLQ